MNLSMRGELANPFTSGSQKAGNVTEAWGADNFYCPNCSSPKLDWLKPGSKANDYRCPNCKFWFQLKGKKSPIGATVTDGAYGAMMEAIQNDRTPNFFFLHYDLATWSVRNLLLVPHFAFPPSAIIKRPPLAATARRAGWVGCNFDLKRIPADARIEIVRTVLPQCSAAVPAASLNLPGRRDACAASLSPSRRDACATFITPPEEVRAKFDLVRKQVEGLTAKQRGWRLDVLRVIQSLGRKEFLTSDTYAFERELEQSHPENRNIKAKIRQQLQELRDRNLLLHLDRNHWRLP
jgi:type II restriction enzyme